MKKILGCRRTSVAVLALIALLVLGLENNVDVSIAVAGVVASVCGANAWQCIGESKNGQSS